MAALLLHALLLLAQGISSIRSGEMTGVLRIRTGEPAAGLRVAAMAASTQEANALVAQTQTDANGRFHLTQIPAGRYYIIAGLVDSPTYYPGTASLTDARLVEVAPNGIINEL